jgi:hypothetical protein
MPVALAAAPATALADDAAATTAYLEADHRLVQVGVTSIPRVEAALRGVLADVRARCPLAAAGSPQNPQSTELSDELIGAMVLAVVALNRPAGRAFVHSVEHLAWSDRSLTRQLHTYIEHVRALLALARPDLCGDVRAWAANGFHTLPPSTLAFSPRFMDAWVGLGELPAALARFVAPAQRALFAQTRRLEERFTDLEAREVETYSAIMSALSLWP